jgi:hypothetical protein
MARLAKLWKSISNCLSELELDLPLNCPLTLELLLAVLLNSFLLFCCLVGSEVWPKVSLHGLQRLLIVTAEV